MMTLRLYMIHRLAALFMAPFMLIHLGVMIYAIQGGLSATEILGRTQGSIFWGVYYGCFVIAAALHAAIALRMVAHEWFGLTSKPLAAVMWGSGLLLLLLGLRAVWAVTGGGT